MGIRSVSLSWRLPIIVVVTVIDIVFVLAVSAIVETLVLVVIVPCTDVIPLAAPVPGLTIEKCISTGGWRRGVIFALSLILA